MGDEFVVWKNIVCYQLEVEPVWETVEYAAYVSVGYDGRATLSMYDFVSAGENIPVKAKATFVDGKPISGSWKVVD